MLAKFVLAALVVIVPLVNCGSPEEMMEMMKMMKKMKEMKEMKEMGGGSSEEQMGGEMEQKDHYDGDSDGCESKEEAMKKKWAMYQKMEKMMKMKKMMEKKHEMEEKMEKMKKFKMFYEKMQDEKKEKEEEHTKKMYEMMMKYESMKKKQEKEHEFKELIESFTEQKHKFAFQLTHHFLTLCKCGEVNAQMDRMFMNHSSNNGTDMMGDMSDDGLMEAWNSGDMVAVADKLKAMSPEQQKKHYMAGLIKSMCTGAKTYVMHAQRFEEQYMHKDD